MHEIIGWLPRGSNGYQRLLASRCRFDGAFKPAVGNRPTDGNALRCLKHNEYAVLFALRASLRITQAESNDLDEAR